MSPPSSTHQPRIALLTAALTFALSACGGSKDADADKNTASEAARVTPPTAATANADAAPKVAPLTLADGPDVCFKAISEQLGKDLKVSEITSFFSPGSDIDSNVRKPAGEMTTCTVKYQSPDDPRKLVSQDFDTRTGKFDPAKPLEITVTGNAADFRLDDYLIPLSQVNAAALSTAMASEKPALESVYSRYAWNAVRLMPPGPFHDKHALRLDVDGRLAANDIKENGFVSISVDGKEILTKHLMP